MTSNLDCIGFGLATGDTKAREDLLMRTLEASILIGRAGAATVRR